MGCFWCPNGCISLCIRPLRRQSTQGILSVAQPHREMKALPFDVNPVPVGEFTEDELPWVLQVLIEAAELPAREFEDWVDNGYETLAELPFIGDDTDRLVSALAIAHWA